MYTLEFRRADGFDRGLPRDVVLVHELYAGATHSRLVSTAPFAVSREDDGMVPGSGSWRLPNLNLDAVVEAFNTSANVATVRFSPADAAVNTTDKQEAVSAVAIGEGTYDWSGAIVENHPGERCAPKSYPYVLLKISEKATVTAHPSGLAPGRPLAWSINDQAVDGSGSLTVAVNYPGVPRSVTVRYSTSGTEMEIWNDPDDGQWVMWVTCTPGDPIELSKGLVSVFEWHPELRLFASDYYSDMEYCNEQTRKHVIAIRIRIDKLRTVPQPVPQGDPFREVYAEVDQAYRGLPGLSEREGFLLESIRKIKVAGVEMPSASERPWRSAVSPWAEGMDPGSTHGRGSPRDRTE